MFYPLSYGSAMAIKLADSEAHGLRALASSV
jgi:hypothetical protein